MELRFILDTSPDPEKRPVYIINSDAVPNEGDAIQIDEKNWFVKRKTFIFKGMDYRVELFLYPNN